MKYTIELSEEIFKKIRDRETHIHDLDCNEYNELSNAIRNAVPAEDYSHRYDSEE